MNYALDPYAKSSPTPTGVDMVASYPGDTSGFLKLQAHAEFYPNYTTILQEFLGVYGNPAAVYVPDVVPIGLIDPNAPSTGGGLPSGGQQQQQYIQQQVPAQVLGLQQQVQQQQQQQAAGMGGQDIMKLIGLGAVAYVLYMVLKKK